jgi:hypothetical protein
MRFLIIFLLFLPKILLGDESLIAAYTFEHGLQDSSGHALHGTAIGNLTISYDSLRNSNVAVFDGKNAGIDLGNDSLFNWQGAFTFAFWFKIEKWQNSWDTILRKTNAWSFNRYADQDAIVFCHWPYYVPTTLALINDSGWHHLTATYDAVAQKVYKDGALCDSAANLGKIKNNVNHIFISAANGSERFFNGAVDDVLFYDRVLSGEEIRKMYGSAQPPSYGPFVAVEGNYELSANIAQKNARGPFRILFSANAEKTKYAFLQISGNVLTIGREIGGISQDWKTMNTNGSPWNIRLLKKGNFYRIWVNNSTAWIRGPLGEWEGIYEPLNAWVGVQVPDSAMVQSFQVAPLPWLQQVTKPLISRGPAGSFYESQIIPGAIIEFNGRYYMYFMAGKIGSQEGAAQRTIAVAVSSDLRTWEIRPEPILSYLDIGSLGDNLYPSGAVITPDNKIALMYAVQKYPEWQGFCLATADHPLGPFINYPGNPVYKHFSHAHEFDLLRIDDRDHRYILFFAGFTPNPPSGPAGDRGYVLYSDDLIHWQSAAGNPLFSPETRDNWDAVHIRPRSLHRIGDCFYLWYEGANTWRSPNPAYGEWWDTVGLARSHDLITWEYYPRNPALPALGISANQFDSNWTGWPRMFIRNDSGYVFYTGNGETGMRPIAIAQLTNWESEYSGSTAIQNKSVGTNLTENFTLEQNYPNPFNSTTTLSFSLLRPAEIDLSIYNSTGQKIVSLAHGDYRPGQYSIRWNGLDWHGRRVGSGIYFYALITGNFHKIRKLLMIQ